MTKTMKHEKAMQQKYGRQLNPPDAVEWLTVSEVCLLTGLSRTYINALERAGKFPRRRKSSVGKVCFREEAVREWLYDRYRKTVPHMVRLLDEGTWWKIINDTLEVRSPAGFVFRDGTHWKEGLSLTEMARNRKDYTLFSCPKQPNCVNCSVMRSESGLRTNGWKQT